VRLSALANRREVLDLDDNLGSQSLSDVMKSLVEREGLEPSTPAL